MGYRAANAGWALLLLYAVAVQYNDPDPVRWMIVYGVGALFSGWAAATGAVPVRPVVGWGVVCVALAVGNGVWGVGQVDPMGGFPYWGALRDEVVREVGGLSLMAGWMFGLAAWTWRRRK